MNANMVVDMAAALIMCSAAKAKRLGIAERLVGVSDSGCAGLRSLLGLRSRQLLQLTRNPHDWRACARACRDGGCRALVRRSVQLLPVRRTDSRRRARLVAAGPTDRDRRAHLWRRPPQQLCHAQRCSHGRAAAWEARRPWPHHRRTAAISTSTCTVCTRVRRRSGTSDTPTYNPRSTRCLLASVCRGIEAT